MENPDEWFGITSYSDLDSKGQLADILQMLLDAELYQVIFMLLSINENDYEKKLGEREIDRVRRQIIIENWKKDTLTKVTNRIITELRKEVV